MQPALRIFVSGMIAADPGQGGAAWAVLQYVLGLRALGHDVYLVEPVPPESLCPEGAPLADSINARYFRDVAARFGLTTRAALLRQDTHETIGVPYRELIDAARGADLLINISGMLTDPALLGAIPRRVYLDLDPAFNQLWHAVEHIDMRFDGHTHFVTVGGLIGTPACTVPTCGRTWQPDAAADRVDGMAGDAGDPGAPWTTVGNWRGYGSISHRGRVLRSEGPLVPPLPGPAGAERRAHQAGADDPSGRGERISRRCARTAGTSSIRRKWRGRRRRIARSCSARRASWASRRAATSSRAAAGSAIAASAISPRGGP